MTSTVVIDDTLPLSQFTATAGQTVFDTNWTVDDETDVVVYARGKDDNADDVGDLQTQGTDYTVSLVGSSEEVRVTFLSGRTADDVITIRRETPADRNNLYTNTNFTTSMLNGDFGRLVMMAQQNEIPRAFITPRYNYSETLSQPKDTILPKLGAEQVWRMKKDETGMEAVTIDIDDIPAPSSAQYYLGTSSSALPNSKNLGALSSGLLKHSVSSGESTPATAVAATDYWAPGNDLTTPNPPVNGDDVPNKTYVDALVTGATWFHSARVASTGNFSATYDNGTAGVGATLTANSNGAASGDGVTLSAGDRKLFKDQSNAFENGIYEVTDEGGASSPAVYTRTTDFNQSDEIEPGDVVPVREGNTNEDTFWVQTSDVDTIGSDSINFALFGINPNNIVTLDGIQTVTGAKTFDDLTLGGAMNADSNLINNVTDPSSAQDAATKNYVDTANKGLQSVQVITANGTWTKPAGIKTVIVEIQAGGGGSGGTSATAAGEVAQSGGGGGGGYAKKVIDVSAISSETVTVGAGGAGGIAGANIGSVGGSSSFGSHASATGGGGGVGFVGTSGTGFSAGGQGGSGTGGNIDMGGGRGGPGRVISGAGTLSAWGGASQLGQSESISSVNVTKNGAAYGAGAPGRYVGGSQSAAAGGNGAVGVVVVWEYS